MERKKIRTTAILALCVAFFVMMAAMCVSFVFAGATGSVSSASIFATSGGASSVSERDVLTYSLGDADGGDAVSYRRNLALKWFEAADPSADAVTGEAGYFNVTFGFSSLNFESFTLTMETTQLSMSEAGKTVNTVVFTPNDAGGLDIAVNGADSSVTVAQADIGAIALSLGEAEVGSGDFTVSVNNNDTGLAFTNIGKYYAQYASSSSSTPVTPLAFTAKTESPVEFTLQSMNGQSFSLDEEGQITDDAAPVLVIDSEIKQFILGTQFDFDMTSIDVCSSSVTSTEYYLANPAAGADFNEDGTIVADSYTEWESNKYFFDDDFADEDGDIPAEMTISVAVTLSDGNSNSASYLLEWYGSYEDGAYGIPVVRPEETTARPESTFFTLTEDQEGNVTDIAETSAGTAGETLVGQFQKAVTAAVTDEDGKQIPVGSGAYYYIPSLKNYITDTTCGYTDMEFTVYYRTGSGDTSSNTYNYDELRIEVASSGTYQFRVVPTNAAGRAMVGYVEQADGSYKAVGISSDNVWDVANLATFEFKVTYEGPIVEPPETEPDIGYVDVSYTFDDFDVTALSGYRSQYTLYELVLKTEHSNMTLAEVRTADAEGRIAASAEAADADANAVGYWRTVGEYDDSLDEDEGDNVYNWNPSSTRSFVPQTIGYYKLMLQVVSDAEGVQPMASNSQIVSITSDADVVPGISQWLSNNVLSVVFLAIGGACLIAIVVLLLVKPKKKPAAADGAAGETETLKDKRAKRK